ncbi:MAG TPA: hypothetical protein PK014_02350 [Thermoanaerobaculia bacterium]|nr:hypothetical protein [Thermoanaerobaculia bacterium]HUM28926.1 hypothetical protein [Thermoanaerobaculia bacterium]HXK67141.1 hypothetical protein [Thermoanaerobaculia bacterium]
MVKPVGILYIVLLAAMLPAAIPSHQGVFLVVPEVDIPLALQEDMKATRFENLFLITGSPEKPSEPTVNGEVILNVYFVVTIPSLTKLAGSKDMILKNFDRWSKTFGSAGADVKGIVLAVDEVSSLESESLSQLCSGLHQRNKVLGFSPPKPVQTNQGDIDFTLVRAQGFTYPLSRSSSLVKEFTQIPDHSDWLPEGPYALGFNCSPIAWKEPASGPMELVFHPDLDRLSTMYGVRDAHEPLTLDRTGSYHTFTFDRAVTWEGSTLSAGDRVRAMIPNFPQTIQHAARSSRALDGNYLGSIYGPFPADQERSGVFFQALIRAFANQSMGPDLGVWLVPRKGGYVLRLVNKSPFPSEYHIERTYVAWKIAPGAIQSVEPGEFDKYRFLRGKEETSRGVSDTIKLFEFYVAPHEVWESGLIYISGPVRGTIQVQVCLTDGSTRSQTFEAQKVVQ